MLDLIEQRPYEQISVREIAKAGNVTFPTFYRQFTDKDDLLSDIATEEIRQLTSSMLAVVDKRDPRCSADTICNLVEDRRPLWTTLLTTGAASIMRDEFIRIAREIVEDRGRINPEIPYDMFAAVVVGGIFEILAWWLRQSPDYPAYKVAGYLEALVFQPSIGRR